MFHQKLFVLVIAMFLSGSLAVTVSPAVEVLSGPNLTMNPLGPTPLAGWINLTTDEPVRVQLTINYQAESRVISFPELAQVQTVHVLGLKPDRTYSIDVDLIPGGLAGTVMATTPALPADFPTVVTNVSVPELMEPGYTLLDCFRRSSGDTREQYTIIVDSAGDVVWYTTSCFSAGVQLPNGHLSFRNSAEAIQANMLGAMNVRVPLQITGTRLHHDLFRTPHGTYLSLTLQGMEVEDFPTSETDPGEPTATTLVRDEPILEFFPDGTLRRQWNLLDIVDPTRIGYDSLNSTPDGVDWAHTNAVRYRAEDDSIVVSLRHQDAVINFSRATGELRWILANHENWSSQFDSYLLDPVGTPFRWQFHQHAPMWTDDGTLVLFDNGNHRASPFDGTVPVVDEDNFSRGVEYEIDTDLMQVNQLWEYGENATERIYSRFISDADWQPITDNRLIHFGGVSYVDGVPSADLGFGENHVRVIEVTGDLVPQKVFDLRVYDPDGGRITMYRSERIRDLYPPEEIHAPNGVGPSLRLARTGDVVDLSWIASPTDLEHTAAEYYIVYASVTAPGDFSIMESTAATVTATSTGEPSLEFYKIVAANLEGTSGDEPPLAPVVK